MSDDVRPEIIEKTQKTLGKYVKKPALSEKLLKKPPFRFLHDVIMVVINETGYLKGLFSENELISSNFTDKESKIQFLNKLIDAVKATTKAELKVKASKIVAGLEAAETNLLLQTIAKAVDRKIDSKPYVESLKAGNDKDKEKTKKKTKTGDSKNEKKTLDKVSKVSSNKEKEKNSSRKTSTNLSETPKSTDRTKSTPKEKKERKEKENKPKASSKESKERKKDKSSKEVKQPKENDKEKEETIQENASINKTDKEELPKSSTIKTENDQKEEIKMDPSKNEELQQKPPEEPSRVRTSSAGLVRPKSARPKSATKDEVDRTATPKNADSNSDVVEMNSNAAVPQSRPKSSLRPPSVRPSSARPGAPRLRPDSALPMYEPIAMGNINVIVEAADAGNDDDEDVVVVHNTLENVEEPQNSLENLNIPLENKGHLVEQILEQIQEGSNDTGDVKKVDIDWEQDANQNNSKDINQLRNLIQNLTKTANPLGKLLNYLHEDVEAMQNELQMWSNTKKQLYNEIDKQKRMSAENDKPLLAHLDKLTVEIRQQEQEIANVRANILRNENRIKELLIK